MNNTLLKLNNEYVKLYVTINPNLPELLKNSGALIVYHNNEAQNYSIVEEQIEEQENNNDNDNKEIALLNDLYEYNINNDLGTNYLYLGNEVIASGWGFDNKDQKDFVMRNLTTIPERINSIIEELNKIIGKSKQQLYVSKEGDLGSYNELYISKNYFPSNILNNENNENNEDNYKIKIKDLPKLLYKAEYKQEEINDVQYSISSITFNGNTTEYNNDYDYIDNNNKCFYTPYNCDLTYQIIIKYRTNDSGQVKSIKFNNNDIDSEYITSITTIDNSITYNTITINKRITNITDIINPIIDITFDKTANYKTYPYLENLHSIENIIPEHTVRINSLFNSYKIVPKNVLYGMYRNLKSGIYNETGNAYIGNIYDFRILELNIFNNYLIIDDNKLLININNKNNERYLLIYIIPKLYNINKIILHSTDGLIHKNILGNFKIICDDNVTNNYNIIYTIIDLSDDSYYLEFNFSKNDIINEYEISNNFNFNDFNLLFECDNTYYLTTSDFDAGYWFTGNENNYFLEALDKVKKYNDKDKFINRFYNINNIDIDTPNNALNKVLS